MLAIEFLSQPIWQRLGLTLLHFLWQGLLVAIFAREIVRVFRIGHGTTRYAVYLFAFLAMAACPVGTFLMLGNRTQVEPARLASSINLERFTGKDPQLPTAVSAKPKAITPNLTTVAYDKPDEDVTLAEPSGTIIESPEKVPVVTALRHRFRNCLDAVLPWSVVVWLVGVIILSFRLLLGFVGVSRWRHRLEQLPDSLKQRIICLSGRLGMRGFSRVFASPLAHLPMAIGYFRPIVLLPAAMLTQLPPEMLEAIIAHELAHIRRFDLWVNLIQRIVETLLFYHPAVWWLSNRLRNEREFCCDELAAKAAGNCRTYASALEYAGRAELAANRPVLVVSFGQHKMAILARVRHVLGISSPPKRSRYWLAGVLTLAAVITLGIVAQIAVTGSDAKAKTISEPARQTAVRSADIDTIKKLAGQLANRKNIATSKMAWDEWTTALASAKALIEQQPAAEMHVFKPLFEPLFSKVGWGGIIRRESRTAADLLVRIGKPVVGFLLEKLKSTEARQRWSAIQILTEIGEPNAPVLSAIRPLLSDKDDYVRRVAIESLGKLGENARPAAEDLKTTFNDTSVINQIFARATYIRIGHSKPEHIRAIAKYLESHDTKDEVGYGSAAAVAASVLGDLGPVAIIAAPDLTAALNHPQSQIRLNAAGALGRIGANSNQTIDALIDRLKNDTSRQVRRSAAASLGRIGPKAQDAIPVLAKVLREADKESQNDTKTDRTGWWVAARAVGQIGGAHAIPVLEESLKNNDPDIRSTAAKALEKIQQEANTPPTPPSTQPVEKIGEPALANAAAKAMESLPAQNSFRGITVSIRAKKSVYEPGSIFEIVGTISTDREHTMYNVYWDLKKPVPGRLFVYDEAGNQILEFYDPRHHIGSSTGATKSACRKYKPGQIQQIFLRQYLAFGSADSPLPPGHYKVQLALNGLLLWEAQEYVAHREVPQDLDRQMVAYSNVVDIEIEGEPVFRGKTLTHWIEALRSSDISVRKHAVQAMWSIGPAPRSAVPALIEALRDESEEVRSGISHVLGEIGPEAASSVPSLIMALKDEYWVVRSEAARALGKIGDKRAVEPLITSLEDIDHMVRKSAAQSLGNLGDIRALEPLKAAAKDSDRELRKIAAWALEQVKPATQPQLEQHVWEQLVTMVSDADLVVVTIKEQHIDNRFEIKQILKGSGHVTFEQLEKIDGMDMPPADETKQWILFLRVERERGCRLYPLVPTGWFVPYSKGLAQKIVEAIPSPTGWGPAEGGLRMGLRMRKSHVALGQNIPVEIHIQNVGQKDITLYQHLMPMYGYHPYTSFELVSPDEKRWKLGRGLGKMSEYDFTPALELSPGETYIHTVRLNKWAIEREPLKPGEKFNLFRPGTYKITCTYSVGEKPDYIHPWNPPKNAWSGTLISSPVELQVIPAKDVIAATQPLSGSVMTEVIKYLQIDGRKREVNWMLRVITSDDPSSKMYHKSNWLLRRGDQANEEHIALIIAGMGTVYDIKASPSGHYLAILSIGEGVQMLEVVDLPLLLMEKKYKVLRTIDPFPGGVAIERWDGDKLVITSGALLTYIGEDGRVPHPSLGWMSPQKYALSVESGGIEALSEGAKNPVDYFIRKLSSSHPWERQDAAIALKELKAKSAIGALKKAVAVESYPGGRAFMQEIVDELEKLPKGGEKPAAVLRWVDDETGQMLFTVRDIVRFDWEQQIFELSRRRAMDLLANQYGLSRPFRVYDSSGVIYRGTFVSSLASMTFDGSVIVVGSIIKNIQPPLYRIDGGYPQGPERDEIRFSERMKMALADAGVFCEIDLTRPPAPFTSIMSEWAGEKEGQRVLVELFPETFQIGEMARIHVHFVGGKHLSEDAHAIEVNATVKANNGEFEYTVQRIFPIGRDGWKKVYVLESMPWGPVLASPDAYTKPGPAEVSVQVSTKRTLYTKMGSYSDLINTIKIRPMKVTILPQDRDVQPTERPSAGVVPDLLRERDRLLAQADAAIRDGIVELAEKFPQLKRAKAWGSISVRSEPGCIGIYFYRTDPGSKPAVRKREDYVVMVDVRPIPSDVQEFQLGMDPIYPNLGLVGLVGAGAGDAELDAALNKLIEKALTPLKRLNEKGGIDAQLNRTFEYGVGESNEPAISDGNSLLLPGSRISIRQAVTEPEFLFAAVCEAVDEAPILGGDLGTNHAFQRFKIVELLTKEGHLPGQMIDLAYIYTDCPGLREHKIIKGQQVIWLVHSPKDTSFFTGRKALVDTPQNRKAVQEAATELEQEARWKTYLLAESGHIKVKLLIKENASPSDVEWMRLDFENTGSKQMRVEDARYGISRETFDLTTDKPVSSGGLASGKTYDLFHDAWKTTPISPIFLAPGMYSVTDHPSYYSMALLGVPDKGGWRVEGTVRLSVQLANGNVLSTPEEGVRISFNWLYPDEAGFEAMRKRLRALLLKPDNYIQHAHAIGALLSSPEVAKSLTVEELLDGIARREGGFDGRDELVKIVNGEYANDSKVIDFYKTALKQNDWAAVSDLSRVATDVFDESFVEPLVKMNELAKGVNPNHKNVLAVLSRYYSRWKNDLTIAPRLSMTIVKHYPEVKAEPDYQSESQLIRWVTAIELLGMTHDKDMVSVLQPFLDCKTTVITYEGGAMLPRGVVPVPQRACDTAYNAIMTLLDKKQQKWNLGPGLLGNRQAWACKDQNDVRNVLRKRDELIRALEIKLTDITSERGRDSSQGDGLAAQRSGELKRLVRKAIDLPVRDARGPGKNEQNPTGLDFSRILDLTGQKTDVEGFTKDHRMYRRDVRRLVAKKKTWALCALLDHPNIDAKILAARELTYLNDPKNVPALLAAAKSNNYPVDGSENATVHANFRSILKQALQKITGLSLTPKGLKVTSYPKPSQPKVIYSDDDPSYFKEEIDFKKVESWLNTRFFDDSLPIVQKSNVQVEGEGEKNETVQSKAFTESVLINALECGNSLVIAKILSVRANKETKPGKFYFYKTKVIEPIIIGDLRESDIKEPVELFAGSSFDDALTPGSTYALFISKGAPYHLSWGFRNDVIKLDGFNDENLQALVEVTTEVYKKTSIREFREAKLMELAPYQILPEMPAIEMLCELFRTNPQNRVEFAKKIYESDMGSRQDHSESFSSQITYLPPKVSLYREQILSLLGEPTLKCGWTYKWFCGEDKSVSEPERYVGILSVTFDKYEKATRVLYNTHESVKWVKFPGKNVAEKLSQSMWGQESHGLQCRVIAPTEIEQGMPLEVTVELKSMPENLKSGVKQLNAFFYDEFVKLSLKNVKTHKVITVQPYSYSYLGGPEPGDTGVNVVPLDGRPMEPWEVSFPLVREREVLEPGLYACTVEYSFPKEKTQWWDWRKDWNSFGFWYGTVVSGPFQLKILEEIPKTKQLLVPKRLRYSEKDGKVNYRKQDAVKIEVPIRNGFFIHTFVYNNTTGALSCTGGVPIPDDINGIDNCVELAKNRKLSYTIKVVETSVPYRHLQPPGPGSPGYKVLWEQTFTVSRPESKKNYELTTRYLPPWLPTAKEHATLTGHKGELYALVISPDGKTLASGDIYGTFKLWDTTGGSEFITVAHDKYMSPYRAVAFSPDGKVLASTGFRDIALTDVATGKRIATFKEPSIVSSMAFSPDGTVLATGGSKVLLLDAVTLEELPGLKSDTEVVGRVAFSPDGKLLASADRTVQLWDMATKKEIASLQEDRWVSCMAFSPNGKMLATGTDRGVKLWDVGHRRSLAAFNGFSAESLAWSPDGKMLAVGEQNGTITLWHVPAAKPLAILEGHQWRISGLTFLPDGHTLVAASSREKKIKLWDLAGLLNGSPSGKDIRVTKSNKVKQLKLMVSVPQETAVDQPVDMLITLTNQGPEEIMLGRGNDSDNCTIQVLDSKERACPLTPLGKQMMGRDGIDFFLYSRAPLEQGELHTWIDLVKYFQLKPGKYTISVAVELNLHTHPFKIAVEDVEFEIIPTYSALYESSPFVKDNRAAKGKKNNVNYF